MGTHTASDGPSDERPSRPHTAGRQPLRDRDRWAQPARERLRPVRRREIRRRLRIALWAIGTAATLAFMAYLVAALIAFDNSLERPEDGFSGWQCAEDSGTCEPRD